MYFFLRKIRENMNSFNFGIRMKFFFFFFKSNLYYKYRESLAKVSLNESALEEPRSS